MKSFLETWRDIEGYEGLYQVSNLGNVRSLGMWKKGNGGSTYFQEGRVLKHGTDGWCYPQVKLCKDGKQKNYKVHRLVAQAFIPNPDNLPEINHKDEDKTNNSVCINLDGSIDFEKSNLEWCTTKYNVNYGTRNERVAETMANGKLSKKPIQLTLDYIFVKEWKSTQECGRNGFDQGAVSACCRNEYCSQGNVYKGYRWMFAEDYYKLFAA